MKIYDSTEVSLIIAGLPVESGRGEEGGAFCKLAQKSDAFVSVVSLDGEVTRSKTNDNRWDVTVILMSTSASNALLSALHTADKLAANGAGVGPFLLKDRQGNTLYAAPACWIRKMPDQDFGQQAVPLEWPIEVANMVPFIGGN